MAQVDISAILKTVKPFADLYDKLLDAGDAEDQVAVLIAHRAKEQTALEAFKTEAKQEKADIRVDLDKAALELGAFKTKMAQEMTETKALVTSEGEKLASAIGRLKHELAELENRKLVSVEAGKRTVAHARAVHDETMALMAKEKATMESGLAATRLQIRKAREQIDQMGA